MGAHPLAQVLGKLAASHMEQLWVAVYAGSEQKASRGPLFA